MFVIPILGAVIYAFALVHYKWLISQTELDMKSFLALHFAMLFGASTIMALWWGDFNPQLITEPRYLLLLLILCAFGFAHNLFLVRGLRRESLHEYELIDLLMPVFTVTLAAFAFADEREPVRLGLALLASGAFFITHFRRKQVAFRQADRWLVYAVFIMAIERILVKPLLELAEPVTLYFFRAGIIALAMFVIFRPKLKKIPASLWLQLLINSVVGMLAIVLIWTSTASYGIVVTELYLLLVPMILAGISVVWLKEAWTARQGFAFAVIIACIVLINILQ